MSLGQLLLNWLKTTAVTIGAALLLFHFVFTLSPVQGHSMEPTLREKQWVFVNKTAYWFHAPRAGDIVILKGAIGGLAGKQYLVKRIIGEPGDRIEISGGKLYRNGLRLDEPYTDTLIEDPSYGPIVVEDGHYFVMGDNRHLLASLDSRIFQAVPAELITGRADLIVWPMREFELL
ncbi:signal peptidase I [Paenibacillus nanensis]|uniref:Signal peptidase I n=1 Tax=Paenibacillus nanensis TaxID=393251 RepID=A0A3A1VHP0_9BACL|nr:signal peptidase I [Paenibacillus nanensis]RIX60448.1 signal peptidase I [Paenibacillus nanensis]